AAPLLERLVAAERPLRIATRALAGALNRTGIGTGARGVHPFAVDASPRRRAPSLGGRPLTAAFVAVVAEHAHRVRAPADPSRGHGHGHQRANHLRSSDHAPPQCSRRATTSPRRLPSGYRSFAAPARGHAVQVVCRPVPSSGVEATPQGLTGRSATSVPS